MIGETVKDSVPEDAALISLETIMKLIKPHIHSINRTVQLVTALNLPSKISIILKQFLEVFPQYIESSLIIVLEDLPNESTRVDLNVLVHVKNATLVMQLIQHHFQTSVLTHLISSPSIHREIVTRKNDQMNRIEDVSSKLVSRVIDQIKNVFVSILMKQKKLDFKPKDDCILENSSVCTSICDVLNQLPDASTYLDGENYTRFVTAIATHLHVLLMSHYKKFSVNIHGAIILNNDLNKIKDLIKVFGVDEVDEMYQVLKDIGGLFLVKAEEIKGYVIDGNKLGRIELKKLYPYISMRSDFGTLGKIVSLFM